MSIRTRCGALLPVAAALAVAVLFAPTLAVGADALHPVLTGRTRSATTTSGGSIYTTDHFEIYYYPEIEQHLERVAGYAESAYQHVSSELKHDLAFKVPLILFKTSSEFQQQNVIPGAAQEGVGAFAEPIARPHRHADGRAARPALPADRPRADAHVRVRHHPDVARSGAACRCG